jgi:DNA polymerase (family 10)
MAPRPRRRRLRNIEIAQKFEAIADMLAMESANPFRVRAYQNAARTLRRYGVEAADLIARGEDLSEVLEGVGEDLAGKIRDLAETGTTDIYEELKRKTPKLAFTLLETPGLGPKRVHALLDELGVTTLAQLLRAARQGRVREVAGFGPKGEAALIKALETVEKPARRTLAAAVPDAEALVAHLRSAPGVTDVVVAGSYRRGRESVGDLDIVVSARSRRPVIEHFTTFKGVADIVAAGGTRAAIVLRTGLHVDLRVVRPESLGAALLYFTGSKAHVVALRAIVRERGMKLNEYGLYRGKRRLAGNTEADVYDVLGLDVIPPELREAHGEIEAARTHTLPRLVELKDIKGDLHVRHDGASIAATIAAAKTRGLSYVAFVTRFDELGKATLSARAAELERARAPAAPMRILHALEVDIGPDGALKAPAGALTGVDFVRAAVNTDLDLPQARQSERILAAIADPRVAVIAHPTCRIINRREPLAADWPRILRAAAENGVALELTGDPDRLDLTDMHCRMARDADALVAIGSEARTPQELERIALAVTQARRGWLEARHILNARSADKMLEGLRAKGARKPQSKVLQPA